MSQLTADKTLAVSLKATEWGKFIMFGCALAAGAFGTYFTATGRISKTEEAIVAIERRQDKMQADMETDRQNLQIMLQKILGDIGELKGLVRGGGSR